MLESKAVAAATSNATDLKRGISVLGSTSLPQGEFSPEVLAHALLECVRAGTEAIIQAGQIAHFAMQTFGPGSSERAEFFQHLVECGFISKAEARAEGQSPKISKLSAIGAHAEILRRPEIMSRLNPGYSTFYEAVQLYREVETESDPVATIADLLAKADGDVNREFLVQQKKDLRRKKASPSIAQIPEGDIISEKRHEDDRSAAELVYLTPTGKDNRRFQQEYATADALSAAYRVNELIAHAAIAVCVTELHNYPVVADLVLPYSGFKYVKKVYLLERPSSAEVSDAKIAIVATRSGSQELPNINGVWDSEKHDGKTLAVQLAPNARSKLHVFASQASPGWECLVGDDAWSEMPSLQGAA